MTHAPHPIFILTSFADDIEAIFHWLGMYEFAPDSQIVSWIGWVTPEETHIQGIMSHLIHAHLVLIFGILDLMTQVSKTTQLKLIIF